MGVGVQRATVVELWRYPVKSMQGERLLEASIEMDGLVGDRRWAVRDEQTGRVLTGRREPRLLEAAATFGDDGGAPTIVLPDGARLEGDGAATDGVLSDWLARPVRLVPATDVGDRAEFFADPTDDASAAIEWAMPPGRFVDAMPLLMLTTASLRAGALLYRDGAWDVRRFRPNLLLDAVGDGWVEDAWCGRVARVGAVVEVVPRQPCVRCTMVTRPQAGLARDLDVYRTLARHHDGNLGVWTSVATPGTIAAGDSVDVAVETDASP
jgi:MOSC domain-containing protein